MGHVISKTMIEQFQEKMEQDEKSRATIEKYVRDLNAFLVYVGEKEIVNKEIVISYKEQLVHQYAESSVNSMLAALNSFFKNCGWYDCLVKSLKVQRAAFRPCERELTREEYYHLLKAAKKQGKQRLYLLMETICATGIRISELQYITVETLYSRRAKVSLKGKIRMIILPANLCRELKRYVKEAGITSGSIFITRNGKPLDRSNVLHDMKALCEEADVARDKVFPHNLRHLFACTYYQAEKDLSHLADLLGHSNINTTRIYTLVSGEEQEKQMEMLGLVI